MEQTDIDLCLVDCSVVLAPGVKLPLKVFVSADTKDKIDKIETVFTERYEFEYEFEEGIDKPRDIQLALRTAQARKDIPKEDRQVIGEDQMTHGKEMHAQVEEFKAWTFTKPISTNLDLMCILEYLQKTGLCQPCIIKPNGALNPF